MGVACALLGETDVAGELGGMGRSDRSLGFVELECDKRVRNRRDWGRGRAYDAVEEVERTYAAVLR